jgi:hypothetical protein
LELHWSREFELLKPKVEDAMVKALTVQRKLIEQVGGVCGSIFPRLLYLSNRDRDYIIPQLGGLQQCRWSIEDRFNTSLNYLARLKCALDKSQGNLDSCRTNGDYVYIVSREFYKDVGTPGLDWWFSDWIFSELGSCQEEPQIPQLTNSSKETGDEHSSERFNARQAAA